MFRRDIQGLRALAVVSVIVFHAGELLPGGYLGVDIFFVVSGFVVSHGILMRHAAGERFSLRAFAFRRFRRLAPEFFLLLLVVTILTFALLPERGRSVFFSSLFSSVGLSNVWFSQEYVGYFQGIAKLDPLLHTWSLAVEEQFYLFLAVAAYLVFRWSKSSRFSGAGLFMVVVALVGVLSLFSAGLGWTDIRSSLPFGQGALGYFSPIPRIWEFCAGVLLAGLGASGRVRISKSAQNILGRAGLLLLFFSTILPSAGDTGMRLWVTIGAVLGATLLILAGMGDSSVKASGVTRALSTSVLVWIGDRSYSFYLWHWPAIVILDGLNLPGVPSYSGLVPGLIVAALAHRFVGIPWRAARAADFGRLASIGALGVSPLLILAVIAASAPGLRLLEGVVVLSGQQTPTIGRSTDCLLQRDFVPTDIDRCLFGPTDPWVALIGDSHADALSDGVIGAADSLGYGTLALTGAGCDFTREPHNLTGEEVSNCQELASGILEKIEKEPRASAVIVSERNLGVHVRSAVEEIKRLGIPIVLVRDIPWIQPNLDAGRGEIEEGPCSVASGEIVCQVSLSEITDVGYREAEQKLIDEIGFSQVVDPWDVLCDSTYCYGIMGSNILYWDDDHLNATGSKYLQPQIRQALETVLIE